ncbi:lactoylglutathione lyase [Croceicoccus estronivorus]|uniref:VOC family protein n=1 Tax=Croceicoccus estronivorus TaxID=1172626 RepID=UPI000832A8F6|nr:VOC family protein [Croceicoccus estronivorus]OCC24785.1 lactoylglutathione lyase [Croceicoccus estronivorus]
MIRIAALDHVVFRVRNMDRMIAFYEQVLGATVERKIENLGLVQLRAGRSLVDLVDCDGELGRQGGEPAGKGGRNVDHVCFQIRPWDEAGILGHLKHHGLADISVSRRYGADGFGPSIYLNDPEGNMLELKGPPDALGE